MNVFDCNTSTNILSNKQLYLFENWNHTLPIKKHLTRSISTPFIELDTKLISTSTSKFRHTNGYPFSSDPPKVSMVPIQAWYTTAKGLLFGSSACLPLCCRCPYNERDLCVVLRRWWMRHFSHLNDPAVLLNHSDASWKHKTNFTPDALNLFSTYIRLFMLKII